MPRRHEPGLFHGRIILGMQPSLAGWFFLAFTTLYVPYAAVRTHHRVQKPGGMPQRGALLATVVINQLICLGIALAVASVEAVPLFPTPHVGWSNLGLAIAFLLPSLGTVPMRWDWRTLEEKRKMLWRLPQKPSDIWGWSLVAFGAGTVEEITYRGVTFQLWIRALGSWWGSTLICSAAFALAHFLQGGRSMSVIFFMAFAAHGIVLATGDLYTVMAIHFVYDLLTGVFFLHLAKRDGLLSLSNPDTEEVTTPVETS